MIWRGAVDVVLLEVHVPRLVGDRVVQEDLVVHAGDGEVGRQVVTDETGVGVAERVPDRGPVRGLRGDVAGVVGPSPELPPEPSSIWLDAFVERGVDVGLGAFGDRHQRSVLH